MARLAIAAFGDRGGGRSTLGWSKTRFSIARLGVLVDITRLQVPPRPPKRQSKGCLFFCQSILAKTVKTPDFLHESSQSGAFCISAAILIYLQRLLPIFLISGGDKSAPTRRIKIFFDYLLFFNQKNVIIKNIRRGYGEKTFDMLKRYCNNNHTAAGGI